MQIQVTTTKFHSQGGQYDGNGTGGQNLDWNDPNKLIYFRIELLNSDQPGGEVNVLLDGLNGSVLKTINEKDTVYEIKSVGRFPFSNEIAIEFNKIRSEVRLTWWHL